MTENLLLPLLMLLPKEKLLPSGTFLPGPPLHSDGVGEDHGLCATYLAAMAVLAKPWNGMLMVVLEQGPLRFSELADRVPTIGDRMLAARLKELEGRGLVVRSVEHGPPVRVLYALTEVGRGFRDVADAVTRWGKLVVRAQESPPASKRGEGRPRARRTG
jgi:DNA-binding HxlR family transcriptional regulator